MSNSQFNFTREDFAASRPAGARSVDDDGKVTPAASDGADKVQALAEDASAGAVGSGPSRPTEVDDESRAKASGLGARDDEAKALVEERRRLAGGGRNPKANASKSDAPSKADLKKAGVEPEKAAAPKRHTRTKTEGADLPADVPEATNTIGTTDGSDADKK